MFGWFKTSFLYLFWFKCNIQGYGITFKAGTQWNNIWLTNSQFYQIDANTQISAIGSCLT